MAWDVNVDSTRSGKRSVTVFDVPEPEVTETHDSPELVDPFWVTRPANVGEILPIEGEIDGVPWVALLVADRIGKDLGWSHLTGFAVGLYGEPDLVTATMNRAHLWNYSTAPTDIGEIILRAANAAEAQRRDIEGTRRTIRAIVDGVPPEGSLGLKVERRESEEVRIAATIYRLVVGVAEAEGFRPKPIKYIAAYLACSDRKAGNLVAKARDDGKLEPGKVGFAVLAKPRKSRGKK